MSHINIPTDIIKGQFNSYLSIPSNSRIFFSGQFGIGKTYFLNEFFDSYKDIYEVFHLYPVNYQISNNEDILELIKYDILVELLKKNKDLFQKNEVKGIKDSSLLFYSWAKKRFSLNGFLQSTLSLGESFTEALVDDPISIILGKLGRPLKDLLEIDKEFQTFKTEYKGGEKSVVEKYLKEIERKSISETDYMTHFLKEKITQQKDGKQSILIIDDLDRIDPEHVFRILNVTSSYFEREHENKFGFDCILIVADYKNIKHLFYHKYGKDADFSGYMDKFYAISPYDFDNKQAILNTVEEIAKSIKNEEPNLKVAIGDSGYIKLFLWHIFSNAIDNDAMNLRSLLKATKFQLLELRQGSYVEDYFSDNFRKIFDIAIQVAVQSFSGPEAFVNKLEIIKSNSIKKEDRIPYVRYIISMLKSFDIKIPNKDTVKILDGKYTIIVNPDSFDEIEIGDGKADQLFYDLLILYIQKKKYQNTNYRI